MSDWSEACDPVPARRELTEAEKRHRQAMIERRRKKGLSRPEAFTPAWVEPDFDDMGA
jgi:hypothetical protein